MATEQYFPQPLPRNWCAPDTSTPSYITTALAKLGAIEARLELIERQIIERQGST